MSVSYIPAVEERPYYQALFQAADTGGKGSLSGGEAVQFFARSKLPIDVLKNIWTVADQNPTSSSLDLKKFAVAIRLIQLTQNGQKGQGPTLAVADGVTLRPVFFEGISGVTIPLPPAPNSAPAPGPGPGPAPEQQQQQQSMPMPATSPMQQGAPMSMSMQAPAPTPTPGGSRAIVSQDPYTMTPQERSRYEDLFPQYAKPDGFVYGAEAVALFQKSGVDQAVLRDIWNMVDRPVDNRLDKLEFAIAMHLIVCISKKDLAPPKGSLPNSLKALKAASSAPATATDNPASASIGSPPPAAASASAMQPPLQAPSNTMTNMSVAAGAGPPQPPPTTSFDSAGPPPIVSTGGMSISDAFEGLSTTSGDIHQSQTQTQSLPSYVPEQQQQQQNYGFNMPAVVPEEPVSMTSAPSNQIPEPAPQSSSFASTSPTPPTPATANTRATAAPAPEPSSSTALAAKYNMGDAHEELGKLKNVLQKLQAENISLKAQLGSMTDEEKEVQKELSAVVTEIGSLSNELHGLRAQVLGAKTKLLEASAELKATREQKSVITDLIHEANETKGAIEDATVAMQNAKSASQHTEQVKMEAMEKSTNFESNLFDYGGNGGAAPHAAPVQSFESAGAFSNTHSAAPSQPSSQHTNAPVMVQTVSSDAEENTEQPQTYDNNAPELFSNEYGQPAPNVGAESGAMPPPQHYQSAPAPTSAPQQQQQQQHYQSAPPTPQHQQPSVYSTQPPSAQPSPNLARPGALGAHHPRQSSLGFDVGSLMGGSAVPLPENTNSGFSPAARTKSSSADFGYEDEEMFQEVEELKKKAEQAADAARDAENAHHKLVTEAEELRSDADKADANARSLKAAATEKKKGRFGRGGDKKKLNREFERAAEDAKDIRNRFMVVQGQCRDSGAVSAELRKEANRLREEAEKAELEMASAASMRDQNKAAGAGLQQAPAPGPTGYPPHSGAPAPHEYGRPPTGYGQAPPPSQGYDYGQPQASQYGNAMPPPKAAPENGFTSGVMGSGGYNLPSPHTFGQMGPGDNANPFG